MPRPALRVRVSKKDQAALKKVLVGGIVQVRVAMRAVALWRLAEGMSAPRIAEVLPMTRQAARNLARRGKLAFGQATPAHHRHGLQRSATRPRGGSLHLVAAEAVKRRWVPRVGRETIRILLLRHDLKPWREKNGVRAGTR